MKINDLNDDCLYEVFDWLSLAEKCRLQRVSRRWQRVTSDMISVQDSLELCLIDQNFFERISFNFTKPYFSHNAYYSYALNEVYNTGVLGDEVKTLLSKFDWKTNPNTESPFLVDNIKSLTINNNFCLWHPLKESVLVRLLAIFGNLKSLKLTSVNLLGTNLKRFAKCSENLESFSTDDSIPNVNVIRFIEICERLKVLDVPKKFIDESDLTCNKGSRSLEQIRINISSIETLQRVISLLPNLTKIETTLTTRSFDTKDYSNVHKSFDEFGRLFPSFAMLPSLKQVDIQFGVIKSVFRKLQLPSDCLEHIESLTLRSLALAVADMQAIAKQFPALSKLAFLEFRIVFLNEEVKACYIGKEENDAIVIGFLEAISTLSRLKCLRLEPFKENPLKASKILSGKMSSFLDAEKLPKLRRLVYQCLDIDQGFEAFCHLARSNPKQSFAFKEFREDFFFLMISEEFRKDKPRNVYLFH